MINFWWAIQSPVDVQTFGTWKFWGLTVPSIYLENYKCLALAMLVFCFGEIVKSGLLSQLATEHVFELAFHSCEAFTLFMNVAD